MMRQKTADNVTRLLTLLHEAITTGTSYSNILLRLRMGCSMSTLGNYLRKLVKADLMARSRKPFVTEQGQWFTHRVIHIKQAGMDTLNAAHSKATGLVNLTLPLSKAGPSEPALPLEVAA